MVFFVALAFSRSPLVRDWVGIVEPDQPGAVWSMKRQRIAEPMRATRSDGSPLRDEFHPMPGFIYEQSLPVQVQ